MTHPKHSHHAPTHVSAVVPETEAPAVAAGTGSPSPVPTDPPAVLPAGTEATETLTGGDGADPVEQAPADTQTPTPTETLPAADGPDSLTGGA